MSGLSFNYKFRASIYSRALKGKGPYRAKCIDFIAIAPPSQRAWTHSHHLRYGEWLPRAVLRQKLRGCGHSF